jgi:hypothetical protein
VSFNPIPKSYSLPTPSSQGWVLPVDPDDKGILNNIKSKDDDLSILPENLVVFNNPISNDAVLVIINV